MTRKLLIASALAIPMAVMAADDDDPSKDMLVVPAAGDRPVASGGDGDAGARSADPAAAPDAAVADADDEAAKDDARTEDDLVSPAFPLSRYEGLWKNSPFQLESIAPPTVSESLAQRYALTGIASIDGVPLVFLMERATQQRIMLKKDKEEGGVSLVQVDEQKKYDESTATIRRGGEVGIVKFDVSAASGGQAMPMPTVPGIPGVNAQSHGGMPSAGIPPQVPGVTGAQPGNIPGQPQAPHVQGGAPHNTTGVVPGVPGPGIPQNGQVQQAPDAPQPGPPRVIRRRAIVPATP